jgi:hypothetical protein
MGARTLTAVPAVSNEHLEASAATSCGWSTERPERESDLIRAGDAQTEARETEPMSPPGPNAMIGRTEQTRGKTLSFIFWHPTVS